MPEDSHRLPPVIEAELERCIYCHGTKIRREGKRRKKHETVQLWHCSHCDRTFTPQRAKGRTYPLKVILEALMLYYRGETRETTSKRIKERFGVAVPARTLSTWLAEYRELTTYARLRTQCARDYRPTRIIRSVRLHHQQVYQYGIHLGKLAAALGSNEHRTLRSLEGFMFEMASNCPHHLFSTDARASQEKMAFNLDAVEIKAKRNHACRIADLVLQSAVTMSCSGSC